MVLLCGVCCAYISAKLHIRKLLSRQREILLHVKKNAPNNEYQPRPFGELNGFIRVENPNRAVQYVFKYSKDYVFPRDANDLPPSSPKKILEKRESAAHLAIQKVTPATTREKSDQ